MHKLYAVIILSFLTASALAQTTATNIDESLNQSLRSNNNMTVVVAVLATIFVAVAAYLIYQDRRIQKIEKEIHNSQTPK